MQQLALSPLKSSIVDAILWMEFLSFIQPKRWKGKQLRTPVCFFGDE